MNQITTLIIYLIVANVIAWYQIQGQFLSGKAGQIFSNDFIVILMGVPIGS